MKTKIVLFLALFCFGIGSMNAQKLGDETDNGMEAIEVTFSYLESDQSRRIEVPQMKGWIEVRFRGGDVGSIRAKFDGNRVGFNKVEASDTEFAHYYRSRGSEKYQIGVNENVEEGGDVPQEKLEGQHDMILTIMNDPNVIK